MRIGCVKNWTRAKIAIENGIWASNRDSFRAWRQGETLIVLVARSGVIVAEVSGAPFRSDIMLWNDDLFDYRIPVKILRSFESTAGQQLNASIRSVLHDVYRSYGWVVLAQTIVSDAATNRISVLLR